MKIIIRAAVVAGLVLVVWWAGSVIFRNPKTEIRQRLNELAKIASFDAKEQPGAKLYNASKVSTFFANSLELKVNVPGVGEHTFEGHDEIVQAALAARNTLATLQVRLNDPNIELLPDKQGAVVDLNVSGDVNGEKNAILQEMKFSFKKIGGDWLITRVESVKTLR